MPVKETIAETDAQALALAALAWTLSDDARARRFLDLTGLDPSSLRESAGAVATLDALLGFLGGHQPDLMACAQHLEVRPEVLAAARERLGR